MDQRRASFCESPCEVNGRPSLGSTEAVVVIGDYRLGRLLGCGGFGKVYACTHTRTGQSYAMKIIERSFIEQHDIAQYVRKEVEMLKKVRHRHVIAFHKSIDTPEAVHIVMELATHGELFDKIIGLKYFEENMARKYFQQLMSAVSACHHLGICHRDLKAENLLLDEFDNLKVCDFGLGVVNEHHVRKHSVTGSAEYQLPEMIDPLNKFGYDSQAADIWAAGVILCFMLCGFLPFNGRNDYEILHAIRSKEPTIAPHVSEEAKNLIRHMLSRDPEKRYRMQQILEDPWFTDHGSLNVDAMFPHYSFSLYSVGGDESPMSMSCSQLSPLIPRVSSSNCLFDGAEPPTCQVYPTVNSPHMVRRAFEAMDLHHTKKLTQQDVQAVMLNVSRGAPIPPYTLDNVMKFFDTTHRGYITYEDLTAGFLVRNFPNMEPQAHGFFGPIERLVEVFGTIHNVEPFLLAQLKDVFKGMDQGDHGQVSKQGLVESPGYCLTQVETDDLFPKLCSLYHRDLFTFEEFVLAVTDNRGSTLKNSCCIRKLPGLAKVANALDVRQYGHAGFTVSGFQDTIRSKLLKTKTVETEDGGTLCFKPLPGHNDYVKAMYYPSVLSPRSVSKIGQLPLVRKTQKENGPVPLPNAPSFGSVSLASSPAPGLGTTPTSALSLTAFRDDASDGQVPSPSEPAEITMLPACVITIALIPACKGYTKVIPSRVSGPTLEYHEAFLGLMKILREERNKVENDTQAVGDSELI